MEQGMIEQFSPSALRDLYDALSTADKDAFLKLIASTPHTANDLVRAFNSLSEAEQQTFLKILREETPPTSEWMVAFFNAAESSERTAFLDKILPAILAAIPAERIYAAIDRVVVPQVQEIRQRDKKARDRKSDPATIRQNVDICDLRKKDTKTWSQRALGKKFGMTRQSIADILEEEDKWRRLFSELPHE
jgi:hypothetical protein